MKSIVRGANREDLAMLTSLLDQANVNSNGIEEMLIPF